MDKKFMRVAMEQAAIACKCGEIPVGAVIVCDGEVISCGYNKKENTNDVTNHAEIIAIRKACKIKKNWRLNGCSLYVTLEPCQMCMGAVIEARIEKVIFGAKNENNDYKISKNKIPIIIGGVYEKENVELLKKFFQGKR